MRSPDDDVVVFFVSTSIILVRVLYLQVAQWVGGEGP